MLQHDCHAAVVAKLDNVVVALMTGMGIGLLIAASILKTGADDYSYALMLPIILIALLTQRRSRSRAIEADASSWKTVATFRPVPLELRQLTEVVRARTIWLVLGGALAISLPYLVGTSDLSHLQILPIFGIIGVSLVGFAFRKAVAKHDHDAITALSWSAAAVVPGAFLLAEYVLRRLQRSPLMPYQFTLLWPAAVGVGFGLVALVVSCAGLPPAREYIGVDLHKAFFQVCAISATGARQWEQRWPTTDAGMTGLLTRCSAQSRIAAAMTSLGRDGRCMPVQELDRRAMQSAKPIGQAVGRDSRHAAEFDGIARVEQIAAGQHVTVRIAYLDSARSGRGGGEDAAHRRCRRICHRFWLRS